MTTEEGIFPHQCIHPDCDIIVQFDDEPWCFTHSPDEGSSLYGWSARKLLQDGAETLVATKTPEQMHNSSVSHNVFERNE